MTTATANERKSRKGHKGAGGRPKGSKDTRPRMNISLRNAMQLFLDEDGNLVTEALREGLQDEDGRVKVAAVKVALEYHIKTGGARPAGRGLVIVLSSQTDPLADRSRPTKPIDLTMSGPVIDAEPRASDAGARAKSPAPASPKKALLSGPAATVAREIGKAATTNRLPRVLQDKDGFDYDEMKEPEFEPEPDNQAPRWSGPRNRGREGW